MRVTLNRVDNKSLIYFKFTRFDYFVSVPTWLLRISFKKISLTITQKTLDKTKKEK